VGTTTYTFTPEAGGCAIVTTMDIDIQDEILPTFAQIGPLCQNGLAPELPLTSTNGINGTWNPAVINTAVVGTTTYTFTPEAGGCAIVTTMDITIEDEILPTFAQIGPLCQNSTAPALPATSLEGINGTWNPAVINTAVVGTTTYTFTPEAGGCVSLYTTIIEVLEGPEIISVNTTEATIVGDDGALEIIANGVALPLQYSLDGINWQPGNTFTGLPIGNGTAWVMDDNGCLDSMDYIIMQIIDGNVEISVDTLNYCLNVPVIIPVEARDFTRVGEFLIELEFDPALLSFVELIAENPILSSGVANISLVGNRLQIRYSWFNGWVSLPSGEDLFSLHFSGNAAGISNLTWNLLQCKVYTPAGDTIPSIFTNGLAEIYPAPNVYAGHNGEFCSGDTLTLVSGSFDEQELEYLWTGPMGNLHHEAEWPLGKLGVNDGGLYRMLATNDYQCDEMREVTIVVNPSPQFRLSYADTVCWGQPLILDPGEFVSYLWQDGSTFNSLVAFEPGVYWVNVTDDKGCRGIDTVALIPCIIELLIPNAFTPNGDGLNDEFKPIFRGFEPSLYHMQIYSKWGQLIFETNDMDEGWDGTINNVLCSPDSFAYIISFEAPSYVTRKSVKSPVAGEFTLIR
jgi:gliding motility-associated-like protein